MPISKKPPKQPRFPSIQKRCKYCHLNFDTKPTYNGSQMEFCCKEHRWSFRKEGKKPIEFILRKQEKRMRQFAREEAEQIFQQKLRGLNEQIGAWQVQLVRQLDQYQKRMREIAQEEVRAKLTFRTEPLPAECPSVPQSA